MSLVTACSTDVEHAEPDDVELGDDKADLPSRPTPMGAIESDRPAHGKLRAVTSGYHLYTFEGRAGEYVRLQLDSPDFRPYLRVTGPAGASERWNDAATDYEHPIDHVYWSLLDLELPATGRYEVIATSVWNMRLFPLPKTSGSYQLTLELDRP
ncbi:MAG: hypothetical protein JNL83_17705 [Myxococcales bacterium]|nr:hypothetical protein [Myxococcales bacterium]